MFMSNPPIRLANQGPLAQLRAGRLPERLVRLVVGLALYGASIALMIEGAVGASLHVPLSFGLMMIITAVAVLLAWIPLRQRPGLGTVSNVVVIGVAVDATLAVVPAPGDLALRVALLASGVLLNAVATAAYIGVHLGPGPRDGLMTGLVRRTGGSVRLVRTSIEVAVVITGWLLGGTLGLGTVVYALAIGPLVQVLLPRLSVSLGTTPTRPAVAPSPPG